MFLQDDYVRTWDENQGLNDSKSHTISALSYCVVSYSKKTIVYSLKCTFYFLI